jgi:hypothetical protein
MRGIRPRQGPVHQTHSGQPRGFCRQCRAEHAGWYRTSSDDRWMGKVTEAIETVFAQRPSPQRPNKATLRDLLGLESRKDISEENTELGAVLRLLDAKTLENLTHFLEEHREEELDRQYCSGHQYTYLCSVVGMRAARVPLPPDMPLLSEKPDTPSGEVIHTRRGYVVDLAALNNVLPFEVAYTSSGRSKNLKTPVLAAKLAAALRQLGVSRSTQKRWHERMEEVGMTHWQFSDAQLQNVAIGKRRGPKPQL